MNPISWTKNNYSSKLLGEDIKENNKTIKLRYQDDLTGITGACYIKDGSTTTYNYIKDGLGNVVCIVHDGLPVVEYQYDAWGNTTVRTFDDINGFYNLKELLV